MTTQAPPPAASALSAPAPSADGAPAAGGGDSDKKRHQLTQVLNIDISPARCHAHMKNNLGGPAASGEGADDGAAVPEDPQDGAAGGVRIGGDAHVAMATIVNLVAAVVLRHAMDETIKADRKMVDVAALHNGGLEHLPVWPLICRLPVLASYDPEAERLLKVDRAVAARGGKKGRDEAAKGDPAAEAEDAADPEGAKAESPTTFNTYIDNVTKTVKAQEQYKQMRVSNRLREVVSQMAAELVGSLTRTTKIAVLNLLKVRTMTAAHLKEVARMTFAGYWGVSTPSAEAEARLASLLAEIDEKVDRHRQYCRAESSAKKGQAKGKESSEKEAASAASDASTATPGP